MPTPVSTSWCAPTASSVSRTAGTRDRIDAALVDAVRSVDGVAAAEGSIQAEPRVLTTAGDALRDSRVGAATWALDWPSEPALNGWTLLAGRAPTGPAEVVLDPTTADEGGYAIGDEVTFVVAGEPVVAEAVGLVAFEGGTTYGGVPAVLAEQAWLASVAGEAGKVDRIDVVVAEGVAPEEMAQRLSAEGFDGVEVLTGSALTEERRNAIGQVVDLFVQLVSAFGAIALFVGAFLIVNTFTIIVTQRTRELALLRALGASRAQVLGSVVVEAFLVAVVAAALGAIASVPVAVALRGLIGRFGFSLPATDLVVTPAAFVVPVLLAVAVTCAAALVPAWRASRTAAGRGDARRHRRAGARGGAATVPRGVARRRSGGPGRPGARGAQRRGHRRRPGRSGSRGDRLRDRRTGHHAAGGVVVGGTAGAAPPG